MYRHDKRLLKQLKRLSTQNQNTQVTIQVVDRNETASFSDAVNQHKIDGAHLKKSLFRFLAPESMKQELKDFMDFENIQNVNFEENRDRFRIYLLLTQTDNPLTLEIRRDQLQGLDELTKLIKLVLKQA